MNAKIELTLLQQFVVALHMSASRPVSDEDLVEAINELVTEDARQMADRALASMAAGGAQ